MSNTNKFSTNSENSNLEISIPNTTNNSKPDVKSLCFWASDSALAFEYFHTRLKFNLVEVSRNNEGASTMCFAPVDDESILFYVHFDQDEENARLLDNDSEYLEMPRQFLKLVPVISSDPGACVYMNYADYE